jgi:hypothetical protein
VSNFSLGVPFEEWQSDSKGRAEKGQVTNYVDRVIGYLETCEGRRASQQDVLNNVTGKAERVVDAIRQLTHDGVVRVDGTPRILTLDQGDVFNVYRLAKRM